MRSNFRLRIYLAMVILAAFFVVLNLTNFSKELKNFFYSISEPIQKVFWQASDDFSDFLAGIFQAEDLKKEVENLYLINRQLIGQIAGSKIAEKENESLREALSLGLEKEFQLVFAKVIGKDISKDSILINKGKKEGILEGLPVITSQKVLLGKVGEVFQDFSEVKLISHKEISFDARIFDMDIYGVAKGEGSLRVLLEFIPKNQEVFEGDLVLTTVLAGVFPEGLLVGKIEEVKKSDLEPFQTAEIKPIFDLQSLDDLFIIVNF